MRDMFMTSNPPTSSMIIRYCYFSRSIYHPLVLWTVWRASRPPSDMIEKSCMGPRVKKAKRKSKPMFS